MSNIKFWVSVSMLTALASCGGGGGGGSNTSTVVASTNAFNLRAGYVSLVSTGYAKTFTLSGTCTGTFTTTSTAASTSATFETAPALSATETATATLVGCTPSSIASTGTRYFNTSYMPLGFNFPSANYGVYASVPVISTAAHVGDTAIVGTVNLFTDSTKATSAGHEDVSYVINPDTSTTAIVDLITKSYNASNVLLSTEQDFYRMAANGTLTAISLDIQYANGSTTHLVGN